jgi:arylsulfatase
MDRDAKNIIMITSDSVRADYCFTSFDGRSTTPRLERFADEGIRFENAISPGPRTASSVPEIIAGEPLPYVEEVHTDGQRFQLIQRLMSEKTTLPERLSERGYTTAAISANPYASQHTGFGDVFEEFYDIGSYRSSRLQNVVPNSTIRTLISLARQYVNNMHWFLQWPSIFEDILDVLESLEEPYFLWIFLLDTHNPYIAPRTDRAESTTLGMYQGVLRGNDIHKRTGADADTRTSYGREIPSSVEADLKRAYRDTIRSVDRFTQTLWETVESDDPVLMFNSDHGEAFHEHHSYGHKSFVYEENVHVPFVVYNSGRTGQIEAPVSLRQIPEMVTEYVDGEGSFTDEKWSAEPAVARTETGTVAVRGKRWKYIYDDEREVLYDLESDPEERTDLSDTRTEVVERLRRRMYTFAERTDTRTGGASGETITDDLSEQLRSLGYVN